MSEILKTPLNACHKQLGAKMVEFGGWEMPLQYQGILQEHLYNRQGCSLFDCSHMGEFYVKGDAVKSGLDQIITQKIVDMPIKTCRYGLMLNDKGGVIDDLIVYRIDEEYWKIVVNAANIEKNRMHIQSCLVSGSEFDDASMRIAKLDLQGPLSREVLSQWVPKIVGLEYYSFDKFNLFGHEVIISRTGYTGELGYEIYYPWDQVEGVWKEILKDKRVYPTGLGVRDVLRIEMCYPLYGHEISEENSPLDAGLSRFIDFNKKFIGQTVLNEYYQNEIRWQTVCLVSDSRRSPREGFEIIDQNNNVLGSVTSGTFSPALNAGIALASVIKGSVTVGDQLFCRDGKKEILVKVVKRPFYTQGSLKN